MKMADGVRESTLQEEINSLTEYNVPNFVIQRLLKKYWQNVDEHRKAIEKVREECYKEQKAIEKAAGERAVVISVLVDHIKNNEPL